jgi:hypothetical protein
MPDNVKPNPSKGRLRMSMDYESLRASLAAPAPPAGLDVPLHALWYAAKGNWDTAHELAQSQDTHQAAWVHAYLHRVEGDLSNAAYWYRQAGRPVAQGPPEAEWEAVTRALLAAAP